MIRLLSTSFAIVLITLGTAPAAPKIRVSFSVTCEDSSSTSNLTGYISNALRSISDVQVVEMDPLFDLSVIAVPSYASRGEIYGYSLAVVVTSGLPLRLLETELLTDLSPEKMASLQSYTRNLMVCRGAWAVSVGSLRVKGSCQDLVDEINGKYFEDARRFALRLAEGVPASTEVPAIPSVPSSTQTPASPAIPELDRTAESLKAFLVSYLEAGNDAEQERLSATYLAPKLSRYYDEGARTREQVAESIKRYRTKWPNTTYQALTTSFRYSQLEEGVYQASIDVQWTAANAKNSVRGTTRVTAKIRTTEEGFRISSIWGDKVR
jgi:hypothetical protein